MYKGKSIGVVVPAYNEHRHITLTINGIPDFVDRVYVVDDNSKDNTYGIACALAHRESRICVIHRSINGGVGAAIITGHKEAIKERMDVVAVMAGDNQMDPAILHKIIDPVVEGYADYSKGNRLSNPVHIREMPRFRRFGNYLLTVLNRIASGYWHISDPQNGYTAISRDALIKLDLEKIYVGFAFENDMLVRLKLVGAKVMDVPHSAIYRDEKSKIKYPIFILKTSWMLLFSFIRRVLNPITRSSVKHIAPNREPSTYA
ncbi:Glycosyltransferase involved in cell wall bisynthesis [Dehalogenimonas formicexedens]|uniref:Glycosyltransferase involved in cell wall bisynthesis n=1 Tax=Dehalogenimonas formicexedens TaxID=1839801 RepID=A0A1P8F9J8_9CHLR|nr:glycosyltransferase family 2 protein [Dehalogenimonas formicexedens]APV45141.1 Glycosyltransferase involved in cell wall bisynthesis [Dehalogenimonas formicexedens]